MRRTTALLALATGLALPATGAAAPPRLFGTVGPGFTITLKDAKGKPVKTLKAGTYTIVVSDRSPIHNFVLEKARGGRFEREITGVGFTGRKTVTVRLSRGKWELFCAPHKGTMRGEITVR